MGNVTTKNVKSAVVFYDPDECGGNRLFEAIGPSVVKYLQEFAYMPVDDTTHDPCEWTNTITEGGTGDSTAVVTDVAGGALIISTAQNENDGYRMQLGHGHGGAGENIGLEGPYPTYFGVRFAVNDADQTDVLIGFTVTDTDVLGAVTDGIYFRSVDESALLYFVMEKDSAETAAAVATLGDAVYTTAEFYYDPDASTVYAYIDGDQVASFSSKDAAFPNNELMRVTIEFLTGNGGVDTCTIDWLRLIHIRG